MYRTIASVPTTQDDLHITDAAVNREVLGPIARRIANNPRNGAGSLGAWLESHLEQYTAGVRALGKRDAAPHYLR